MWDKQFEDLLRGSLPFLTEGEPMAPDLDLRDHGLDSLGTVDLLTNLEQAYDVRFVDDALNPETFATPEVLWRTVCTLRDGDTLPA